MRAALVLAMFAMLVANFLWIIPMYYRRTTHYPKTWIMSIGLLAVIIAFAVFLFDILVLMFLDHSAYDGLGSTLFWLWLAGIIAGMVTCAFKRLYWMLIWNIAIWTLGIIFAFLAYVIR